MELAKLLANTDIPLGEELAALEVHGVSYDTRRLQPGDVFIALGGTKTDGSRYALDAEQRGAAVYIGEKAVSGLHIPQLLTENARRTLAFACANQNGNPQNRMRVIGVTGTNGKTTTAYMLRTILAHSGYKTALIGTVKSMIGEQDYLPRLPEAQQDNFTTMTTPDPDVLYMAMREMAEQGVEILVMEASSHALALEKLAPIAFALGIFTNLSEEHLDFHGTMENYLAAKAKLFRRCRLGLYNADDAYAAALLEKANCKTVGFGMRQKSDYYAEQIRQNGVFGSEYILHSKNARFKIKTTIPGDFTLYNTLAAAAAAREMGVDLMNIQNALYSLNGVCGRLQRVDLGFAGNAFTVFIDYAHTPYALENLLRTVNGFRSAGQRIVTLFGCGGDRDKEKRPIMGALAVRMSDYVILTGDNARTEDPQAILSDVLEGMQGAKNYTVIEDRREAIEYAIENALEGDIILLVGKGHEQYEIDKDGLHPFSEIEIAEKAAEKRRK
ncbi:MAG: UDP-N-acetylmuramoyl-L-alanyl-D-glutamate--2,6-diaminopimelate ligase [Clostridia bacterium]|nr:UDP-N-acetylmuramoyl-L-alanyl-D-glutamate--2,6-diaminopimelate ligase [Clostridia bacterium]